MFTHLHLHTDYSLLDGVIRIPDLVGKLKENKMTSCAITDHGNMYGVVKFVQEMKKNELKPIIGCEIYIAPRSRFDKEHGIDNKYYHMTLLAKNLSGYKNLMKIVSIGHMEGYYYKPRVDFETLEKYSEGIVALSGCLQGVLARKIREGENEEKILLTAEKYKKLFLDNFYIEIQRNGIQEQEQVNTELIKISKKLNIPYVATCDAHVLNREDVEIQEILWAISDGKTISDPTRRKIPSSEFYVKTEDEMNKLFKDIPEAVTNTTLIADSIESFDITFGRIEPSYKDLPKNLTPKDYLKKLAYNGCKKVYGKLTKDLKKRIDYELSVIHEKGYDDYFLIVRMIIVGFCRKNGIVVSMRGSGTGSVVAYCIGITSIDPIKWELYFERFLNPERKSAPDFDIDMEDRQRDKVIDFVVDKFGHDAVKQIITFSKLQTRQAIRDISRVLEIDLVLADKLSKLVEILFGKSRSIDYMLENNPEFKELAESSDKTKKMIDIVRKVSGLARGVSTHACGIIIAPEPVVEYVPIQKDSHNEGIGITQYEFMQLEEIGLMKFDFLGLRNLNVIGNCLKKIQNSKGISIDLQNINWNDRKAFNLIKEGNTIGIFQMESEGMKRTIRSINPDNLEDLCYILAAYRPGPMEFIPEYAKVKSGKQKPKYIIPELEPILRITNGVITYQEQVIRIAVDIAGYTMGQADILRKAMGKKMMDIMDAEKPIFIDRSVNKGFDRKKIEKLWDLLLKFANYGFNKAHSAMYATVSYWTAFLKGHYPLEFMAALLEGDLENFDRVVVDLEECQRLGFRVLPPTINRSSFYFSIEGNDSIRFGLGAIKNVGKDIIKVITSEREKNGIFRGFDDFIGRMIDKKLQLKTTEYLIMAGTLDEFGDRKAMISILPKTYEKYKKIKQIEDMGQMDLFNKLSKNKSNDETSINIPTDITTPTHEILQWEKELLGIYFTSHPLENLQEFFTSKKVIPIRKISEMKDKEIVVLGVLITKVRRITTKKGDRMAFLTVEDKSGSVDIIVFPRSYEEMKDLFEPNKPILIAGRVSIKDNQRAVILEKSKYIDQEKFGSNFSGITFTIKTNHSQEEIDRLKTEIKKNKGTTTVRIILEGDSENRSMILENCVQVNSRIKELMTKFS